MFGAALFLAAGVVGFAAGRGGIAFLPLGGYALFLLLSWAQGAARKDAEKGYAGGTFAFEMLLLVKTAPLLCLFLLPGTFGNVHSERATDVAHSFLLFFCVLFLFANAVTEHAALRRALARGDALDAVLPRPLALALRPVSPFTFATLFAALAVHALGAGFIGPLPLLAACALALPLGAAADAFLYAAPSRSGTALFAAFSLARAGVPLLVLYFYRNGLAGALETSPFRPAFCALCILSAALLCAQLALALFGAFFAASTFPREKKCLNRQRSTMKRLHPEHIFLFLSYALYLAAGVAVWVAMGGGFAPPDDSALILAAFLLLTAPLAAALFLKKEKTRFFFAALTLFSLVKNLFLTLAELLLDYNNIYFPTQATRSVCILVFVGAGVLVCAAELAAIVLAKWRKRAE